MSKPQAVYISPDCDLRPLVRAMVEEARRESMKGNYEANRWLMTEGIAWIDAAFDIHPDHIKRWARGYDKPPKRKRPDPRRWDKYKKPVQPAQVVTAG